MQAPEISNRTVLRVVLIVIGVVLGLYLVYLLRKPLTWVVIATFIAIAISGPINRLARHMRRGLAVLIAYVCLFLVPVGLGAIVVPPIVNGANDLANKAPDYAGQARDFVNKNKRLRKLESDYGVITQLETQAKKLPTKLGGAAGTLKDLGIGIVNSIFAGVTILILSVFLAANGRRWVSRAIELQPRHRAERLEGMADRIAAAIGSYVSGALAQATIAGITAFVVMEILGIPFAGPLAVLVAFADLIPLVGATIAAVLVAIVTLFADFPVDTIVWVVFAVIYQQVENAVIQPQIQRRAVDINPFIVLISVLFGSTLFGILGALLAIPIAASLQIVVLEWWEYRQESRLDIIGQPPGLEQP